MPGSYDLRDDYGVWVPCYRTDRTGRWATQQAAQLQADVRNHQAGVVDAQGRIKQQVTAEDDVAFQQHHLRHPECTCNKLSKTQMDEQEKRRAATCVTFDPDAEPTPLGKVLKKSVLRNTHGRGLGRFLV